MSRRGAGALVVLAASAWASAPASAQVVRGVLLEDGRERVVSFGAVALVGEDMHPVHTVTAGIDGRFELRPPEPGSYWIYASALGYHATLDGPLALAAGETIDLEFRIPPDPLLVDSLTVTVQGVDRRLDRVGFYDRAVSGLGIFMSSADIRDEPAIWTTDLFKTKPGVSVRPASGRGVGVLRNRIVLRGNCSPIVWLDGMRLTGQTLDEAVHPGDIAGIEIYRGIAEVPSRFGGPGVCGVVVVWTH